MTLFAEITLLVIIATVIAFVMRALKQPLVIGYIITGLIVGPVFLDIVQSEEILHVFSELGVALLLFIVGLNLTPKTLKDFGKISIITGLGQVLFTVSIGLIILSAFGFPLLQATYVAIGLAFSSTIIILKLLSDKGDLERLYGKISVGFLLVQDFIAILILFAVPILFVQSNVSNPTVSLVVTISTGIFAIAFLYILTRTLLPKIYSNLARS